MICDMTAKVEQGELDGLYGAWKTSGQLLGLPTGKKPQVSRLRCKVGWWVLRGYIRLAENIR